jgi:hypothetical protein
MLSFWYKTSFKLSSIIFNLKKSYLQSGVIKTLLLSFLLLFFEILLALWSLPIYLFFKPEKISHKIDSENFFNEYKTRRRVTALMSFGILVIWLSHAIFISWLSITAINSYIKGVWTFNNPNQYIFKSGEVDFNNGIAVIKNKNKKIVAELISDTLFISQSGTGEVEDLSGNQGEENIVIIEPQESINLQNTERIIGFNEITEKNGGEILYQLTTNDG